MAELVARGKYYGKYEPYHYGSAVQYRRPNRENGAGQGEYRCGNIEYQFAIVCPFRLSCHVDDKDGYRAGSGEVAGFKLDLVNQVTKAYYQLMLSQDSYEVLQKSYELAEENYNIVNAKYQQGAVSEFDKITAEVQMRSVKPSVISAGNAVTLSNCNLRC